jgi:hypothetical protein
MGLNEFAGYLAVAGQRPRHGARRRALGPASGAVCAGYGLSCAVGLAPLLALVVRETWARRRQEARCGVRGGAPTTAPCRKREVFRRTTLLRPGALERHAGRASSTTSTTAWPGGSSPWCSPPPGSRLAEIGALAAHLSGGVGGLSQLVTGALLRPDRPQVAHRRGHVGAGGGHRAIVATLGARFAGLCHGGHPARRRHGDGVPHAARRSIGDVAHPSWRASSVGVYRLWRDLGYALGALVAGLVADALGLSAAVWLVAALTLASGALVAARMRETLGRSAGLGLAPRSPGRGGVGPSSQHAPAA